jgi:hypothetical protein
VYFTWEQLIRENGTVGFSFDFDGFVESVMPPDYKNCLKKEEQRLMNYFAEVGADKCEADNMKLIDCKGITPRERRDLRATIAATEKAFIKARDYLIDKTTTELATVYLEGKVKENGGVPFQPGSFAISDDDGPLTIGRDLGGLLDQLTYAINIELKDVKDGFEKIANVSLSPLTLEETRNKFEQKKAELEASMEKDSGDS